MHKRATEGRKACDELATMSASSFLLPVCDPAATDPDRVGPKAANLAALAQAGLPTPGGFCITADHGGSRRTATGGGTPP
jgi:hypothetical protein